MRRISSFAVLTAAVALAVGSTLVSLTRADDAPATAPAAATGSVKVTVLKPDGTEFDGTATVVIVPPMAGHGKKTATGDAPPAAGGGKGNRPKPVAGPVTITPDDKGVTTIKDVPVGDFSVGVLDKADKLKGTEKVTVVAGDTPTEVTVTLKAGKKNKAAPATQPAAN